MSLSLKSLATPLLLGSLACAPAGAQQTSYDVALDGTFAPHAMPTMDGGLEGFNVDLANAIGEQLGAEMNITGTQFSGLIPALEAGTYDFIVAPTTVTEERAANLLFSEGYLDTDFQFVVRADAPEITDLEQLRGETLAVNRGSAYDSWARERAEEYDWTVENYGTNSDAVQAVMSGRAFANLAGNTVSAWAVQQNDGLKLSYLVDTGLVWAMPFREGDTELRNMVERAIECLKVDGTMTELSEKWFDVTPANDATAVVPVPGSGPEGFEGYVDTEHELDCT